VSKQDQVWVGDFFYFTAYAMNPKKMEGIIIGSGFDGSGVKVVFGKFKTGIMNADCGGRYSTYWRKKTTDVNLAIKLFQSAINNDFDTAIIVSGDSDLIID